MRKLYIILYYNMPINKGGGNRTKKQGRKYAVSGSEDKIVTKTRFAKDADEIYAAVIKEYGNGRALVKCIDGVERLLHIRKKFKGRSKGQDYIKSGVWVLAGLRSWESSKKEGVKENCDLLEVYCNHNVQWLKRNEEKPWCTIETVGQVETYANDDEAEFSGDEFDNDQDDFLNEYLGHGSSSAKSKSGRSNKPGQYIDLEQLDDDDDDDDDEFDIDDL